MAFQPLDLTSVSKPTSSFQPLDLSATPQPIQSVTSPSLLDKVGGAISSGVQVVSDFLSPPKKGMEFPVSTPEQVKAFSQVAQPVLPEATTVKYPFMDTQMSSLPTNPVSAVIKWGVELPEEAVRTALQAVGKDLKQGAYSTNSPKDYFNLMNDSLTAQGVSPTKSSWISGLFAASQTTLDLVPLFSLTEAGVKALASRAVTNEELVAAHTLLGSPTTMQEMETNWRAAIKVAHPDVGGSQELASALNNAHTILENQGLPRTGLVQRAANFANTLVQPMSELGNLLERGGAVVKPTPSFEPLQLTDKVEPSFIPTTKELGADFAEKPTQTLSIGARPLSEIQQELSDAKLHLSFLQDAMDGHPGKGAGKYLNWRTDEFLKGADAKYQSAVGQEVSGGGDLNVLQEQQQSYKSLQTQEMAVKNEIKRLTLEVKNASVAPGLPRTAPITPRAENMPPELQPLAEEARKYKSAKEFTQSVWKEKVSPDEDIGITLSKLRSTRDGLENQMNNYEVGTKQHGNFNHDLSNVNNTIKEVNQINQYGYKSITDFYNKVINPIVPEAIQSPQPVVLASGFNPHLDTFIEQDVKPAIQTATEGTTKTWDWFKKTISPASRGEAAEKTAVITRESLGRMAHQKEIVYRALQKSRKIFDTYSKDQSLTFIDNLETGKPNTGAEQFTAVMREALDTPWKQIQAIKGTDAYIDNYFPHIWKDPEKASQVLQGFGKRPLEGTKGYMKQRTIPTIREGVALGLEPASYNPVDLVMTRVSDMQRFLMAHDIWTQFKEQGLRKFVSTGENAPMGWIKVNDKISTAFQFSPEEKGLVLRGSWYMPEQAATIINHYLSPGLTNNPLYNGFRMLGNTLNQVQLSISGYHAFFTSGDAVISYAARQLAKGTVGGIVKAVTSPITAPYLLWKNLMRGNALLTDYFSKNPAIPELVDALERAGGRVRMDSFYLNNSVENFLKAVRSENYIGALIRAPGATIEALAKPIMQELVPRQKLGVFADMAKDVLEQAQKEGWTEYKTTLRLQEVWDAVDNRMGQLVYDNLFWNKTLKDLGMASTRSLGWNLGTFRIAGGAIKDFTKLPIQLATEGGREQIRMTPNMAYTIALPYVVGVWGAIIYYLYNHKAPETALDYFYPKTGKTKPDGTPERISLPSYMKDVFAWETEGLRTAANKLHPEISALIQMMQNKDYFSTEIRNPNDPLVKQMEDLAAYQVKQFMPFTITNLIQRQKTGGSWNEYLQSFAGITPAPGYITRTPLQTEIYNLYDKRFGGGVKTQEQADIAKQKAEVRTLYLQGKEEEANKALDTLVALGIVKNKDSFIKEADIPNDIKLFTRLPAEDQTILVKEMNLAELARYAWYVHKDVKSVFDTLSSNTKAFAEMEKTGEVQKPVWEKGQDTNKP